MTFILKEITINTKLNDQKSHLSVKKKKVLCMKNKRLYFRSTFLVTRFSKE